VFEDESVSKMRKRFNRRDLGNKLLDHWYIYDTNGGRNYIIAGALLMRAGARINSSHLELLRSSASEVYYFPGDTTPHPRAGLFDAAKVQFLNALEHYQPGVPHKFEEPRYVIDQLHSLRLTEVLLNHTIVLIAAITAAKPRRNWEHHLKFVRNAVRHGTATR
jgi:hypothetical protein